MSARVLNSPFRRTEMPRIPLKIEKEPDHFKVAKVVFPILFSLAGFWVLAFDVAFTLTAIVSFGALFLYHEKESGSCSRIAGLVGGMNTPTKSMPKDYLAMSDGTPLTKETVSHLRERFPDVLFCPVDEAVDDGGEISDVELSPGTIDAIQREFPHIGLSPFPQRMDNGSKSSAGHFQGKYRSSTPGDLSPIEENGKMECMRAFAYTLVTPHPDTPPQDSPMSLCTGESFRGEILVNNRRLSSDRSKTPFSDVKKRVAFNTEPRKEPDSEEEGELRVTFDTESENEPHSEEGGEFLTPKTARQVVYYLKEQFPDMSPFQPRKGSILRNSITPRKSTPSSSGDLLSSPSLSPLATPSGKNWKNRAGHTPFQNYSLPPVPPNSAPAKTRRRNAEVNKSATH